MYVCTCCRARVPWFASPHQTWRTWQSHQDPAQEAPPSWDLVRTFRDAPEDDFLDFWPRNRKKAAAFLEKVEQPKMVGETWVKRIPWESFYKLDNFISFPSLEQKNEFLRLSVPLEFSRDSQLSWWTKTKTISPSHFFNFSGLFFKKNCTIHGHPLWNPDSQKLS